MSLKGRSCYRNSCPRAFPDGSHTRGACPGAFPAPSPVSLCNAGPFFRLAGRGRRPGKGFPQLTDHFRKPSGGEPHRFVRFRVVPRRGIVRLFQQGPDFDFPMSFSRFFSTLLRQTNVYRLAFDSIFVPSIYSTSRLKKPFEASTSTSWVNTRRFPPSHGCGNGSR